jgi:hypothetical protein
MWRLIVVLPSINVLGVTLAGVLAPSNTIQDVTNRLELLGNPTEGQYSTRPYAQNVWDMQRFENRIYLGSGNSSNKGPDRNSGPAHVHSYDTVSNQFRDEFTTNEEQIERYVPLRDQLCIPGHDPLRSTPASIYCLPNGDSTWQRIGVEGIHIFDLEEYNNQIWVGRGTFVYQANAAAASEVASFLNRTPVWNYQAVPSSGPQAWRIYNLFTFGGTLIASGEPGLFTSQIGLSSYNASTDQWLPVTNAARFFPGAPSTIPRKKYTIRREAILNGALLYIGARFYNDQQSYPFGLYRTNGASGATRIPLETGFLPMDLMVKDGLAMVLAFRPDAPDRFTHRVYQSTDLVTWQPVFDFVRPSFARSFEWANGDLYFGMGIEWSDESQTANYTYLGTPSESGNIYRLRGSAFRLQKTLRRFR